MRGRIGAGSPSSDGSGVHEIVERLHFAAPGVDENLVEPPLFRFAGEQRHAHRLRLPHLGGHFRQHGDAARNVESADADLHPFGAKLPGDVEGAGELVRLHPDDADQRPPAAALQVADDPGRRDAPVGLVVSLDGEVDAGAQNLAAAGVLGETVHAGEGVGRQGRPEPLNWIAPVVVVGGLDQNESKA